MFALALTVGLALLPQGVRTPPPPRAPVASLLTLERGWTRAFDGNDSGRSAGWADGRFPGATVPVPNVANADAPLGRAAWEFWRGSVVWYRRTIRVPAGGDWRLTFGSAHFEATVWLNGHRLGFHRGAYEPFGYTLRGLRPGRRYRLAVRVDYRDPKRQARLGYYRAWFNWGGINRPVTLRQLGPSDLGGAAMETALRSGGAVVRVSVTVRNRLRDARSVPVRGTLAGQELNFGDVRVSGGGSRRIQADVAVPDSALWSPDKPRMAALRVAVPGEALLEERAGLREIRAENGRLLVNGEPIILKGASIHEDEPGHGDALTERGRLGVVRRLQAIGANATRAQHALDPRLLDRLDRAGILVWQHVGPFDAVNRWRAGTSRALTADAEGRVRRQAAAERLHPSIVAWNLVNEVAGNGVTAAQVRYVRKMAGELRRIDPGRLVAVDLWGKQLPKRPGPLFTPLDAVGLTDYTGWSVAPIAPARARIAAKRSALERFAALFGDKVRVVTEFGAGGNRLNRPDGIGGFDYQARLLAEHLRVQGEDPGLDGSLVWVLSDFRLSPDYTGGSARLLAPRFRFTRGLNDKGLFDRAGKPKPAAAVVRRQRQFGS